MGARAQVVSRREGDASLDDVLDADDIVEDVSWLKSDVHRLKNCRNNNKAFQVVQNMIFNIDRKKSS